MAAETAFDWSDPLLLDDQLDEEERLRSFDKTDLRELTVLTTSPMPSYAESLTETELADLLAYLVTLKGL